MFVALNEGSQPTDQPQDHGSRGRSGASSSRASAGSAQPQQGVVKTEVLDRGHGFVIEVKHYNVGAFLAEVIKREVGKSEQILGRLKLVLNRTTNYASMNAICKIHTGCQCWLSNIQNSDLLLDWLAQADRCTQQEHQVLARDLKKSLGMKVRA